MPPFLQCRQQSVQYKKLPRALHQLLVNLYTGQQEEQNVRKGTHQRKKQKKVHWQSHQQSKV